MNKEIIEDLFKNNLEYFRVFFRKNCSNNRELADDIIATVFLSMLKSKTTLDKATAKTYITVSIVNCYKKYFVYNKRFVHNEHLINGQVYFGSDQSDELALEDRFNIITEFIQTLPKKQKEVAIAICKGISMKQYSEKIGVARDTTRANWRQIAIKLKDELNKKGEDFLWKVNT